jgi:4'-phosphopantetheinyl transferase
VTAHDAIDVWCAPLDLAAAELGRFGSILAADEIARAERFHRREDGERFIAARGILRTILGRYLDLEPGLLRFRYGAHGKPELCRSPGRPPVTFNLSHAHGLAICAVAGGRKVGVDLEYLRPGLEYEAIAARFFSAAENSALRALPGRLRRGAFFRCWVRKEAYLKARGEGLTLPLCQFDVSLAPGQPARLLASRDDPDAAFRWSLREIEVPTGYVAALAAERHDWLLKQRYWPEDLDSAGGDRLEERAVPGPRPPRR